MLALMEAVIAQARRLDVLSTEAAEQLSQTIAELPGTDNDEDDERSSVYTFLTLQDLLANWQPKVLDALRCESDAALAALLKACKKDPEGADEVGKLVGDFCASHGVTVDTKSAGALLDASLIAIVADLPALRETASSEVEWLDKWSSARVEVQVLVRVAADGRLGVETDDDWMVERFADRRNDGALQVGDRILKVGDTDVSDAMPPKAIAKRDYADACGGSMAEVPITVSRLVDGFSQSIESGGIYGYILRAGSATSMQGLRALDPYEPVPLLLLSPDGERMGVAGPLPPAVLLGISCGVEASGEALATLKVGGLSKSELSRLSAIKPDTYVGAPTLLRLAAHNDCGDAVRALVGAGASVEEAGGDESGGRSPSSPLIIAAESGAIASLRALVDMGASLTATHEFSGATPLHLAARRDQAAAVSLLLELNAPIGAKMTTDHCQTPLHLAVDSGSVETVRVLVAHGADKGALDRRGHAIVTMAARCGSVEVLKALAPSAREVMAQGMGGVTAAVQAVCMGHVAVLQELARIAPACLQVRVSGGQTLLMQAIVAVIEHRGHLNQTETEYSDSDGTIAFLLEQPGVDIHARSLAGATALFLAAGAGSVDLVTKLAADGAEIDCCDKAGTTAMTYAAEHGHASCVRALHELNADVHAVSHVGSSMALSVISSWNGEGVGVGSGGAGYAQVLRLLHGYGLDFSRPDEAGWTPAMHAASRGNAQALSTLHELGVPLDVVCTITSSKITMPNGERLDEGSAEYERHLQDFRSITPAMLICQQIESQGGDGFVHALRVLYEAGAVPRAELLRLLKYGGKPGDRPAVSEVVGDTVVEQEEVEALDFAKAVMEAMGACLPSATVQLRGLMWLHAITTSASPDRTEAPAVYVAAMNAHRASRNVQEAAVLAAHALCCNGVLQNAGARDAVVAAGLAQATAHAMSTFGDSDRIQGHGCAVFWCHTDGGCEETVLGAGGVRLAITALCSSVANHRNSIVSGYWCGPLTGMLRGPTQACRDEVAQQLVGALVQGVQQMASVPPSHQGSVRDIIFLLVGFIGESVARCDRGPLGGFRDALVSVNLSGDAHAHSDPPPSDDSLVRATVKIRGLQSKPELNGATAFVLAYVAKSARFCVSVSALRGGELPPAPITINVKPESLVMESAAGVRRPAHTIVTLLIGILKSAGATPAGDTLVAMGCSFLPALVGGEACLLHEAIIAGAQPAWLDPENVHVRKANMLREKMSDEANRTCASDDAAAGAAPHTSGPVPLPSELMMSQKRFAVGAAVLCRTGATEWSRGVVVAHDYTQEDFPAGMVAAYQIKLSNGTLIFAPYDVDECIRQV